MLMEGIVAIELPSGDFSACRAGMWVLLNTWEETKFVKKIVRGWNEDDDSVKKKLLTRRQLKEISGCYKIVIRGFDARICHADDKEYPIHNGEFDYKEWDKLPTAPKLKKCNIK